jgi:hypothetical protein
LVPGSSPGGPILERSPPPLSRRHDDFARVSFLQEPFPADAGKAGIGGRCFKVVAISP